MVGGRSLLRIWEADYWLQWTERRLDGRGSTNPPQQLPSHNPTNLADFPAVFFIFVTLIFVMKLTNKNIKITKIRVS